ncbi:MAG: S8 family serine peptidase [Bacteroidota bacterium]
MKKFVVGILFISFCSFTFSQDLNWVFLTDKGSSPFPLEERVALSQEAIALRAKLNIPLDEKDVPVYSPYMQTLRAHDLQLVTQSRWLNAVVVRAENDTDWAAIYELPFVKGIKSVGRMILTETQSEVLEAHEPLTSIFDYGEASFQNNMLNMAALHSKGYTGKGVRLAVFDGGFPGVDTMKLFDSVRIENRLLGYKDFVKGKEDVFHSSSHGTRVLSTIATNIPGSMVGSAPHVSVMLCITEDVRSETRKEEHNWAAAMEWADSMGVQVVHSSLGYSEFDSPADTYSYSQMNGDHTVITRMADIAASKGILVTTSAGNEGSGEWKYITAPCDADSVLCIGSVDREKVRSRFSSYGPTYDGRIKPDVVAMGTRTTVAGPSDMIRSGNGTSFSSPTVAGLVACLKQAHPERNIMDIIQAVRMSGDNAESPNNEYGYGIPDAGYADEILKKEEGVVSLQESQEEERKRQAETALAEKETEETEGFTFTENPQTLLIRKGNKLTISTPSSLEEVILMYGDQLVSLPASDIKRKGDKVKYKTKYLVPGEYYVKVVTDTYTEYIPFIID